MGLVPKLILAIIIGILFGQFLPEGFCRLVVTLSGFFSNFLKFIIPLMILAYVTMGIADLSQGAGKLLLITVALAYSSTLIAGSASFLVAENLFPSFMSADALDQIAATAEVSLSPYHHPASHGHSVRSCACLCFRTLPVFHARQGDRRYPLQCNQGFFFYY